MVIILLFSLDREKPLFQGFAEGQAVPKELFRALWQSRHALILVTVSVFLISAIGVTVVISFDSLRRRLQEVKGLARNLLASIPTGVIPFNPNGRVTAINPSAVTTLKRSNELLPGQSYKQLFPEGDMIRIVLDGALHGELYMDHHDMPYRAGDQTRTVRLTTADLTECDGSSVGVRDGAATGRSGDLHIQPIPLAPAGHNSNF